MRTALQILEQELNANKIALAHNEMARAELLRKLNIDKVDTEGDEFADKYTAILKDNAKLQSAIGELEQAIFYLKRAIETTK